MSSVCALAEELAWTASQNNYYQYLTVGLPDRHTVTAVATQGKKNTREYVTEYMIQYSDDGDVWRMFKGPTGTPKVVPHLQYDEV